MEIDDFLEIDDAVLKPTFLAKSARPAAARVAKLVPSGSLDGQLIEEQIRQEFCEETGLGPEVITAVEPFCLILDERHQAYDIGCRLEVDLATATVEIAGSGEYEDFQWVELDQLDGLLAAHSCVPTSRALWQAYQQHTW